MPVYKCNGCLKDFDKKCNYENHINKKKPCKQQINEDDEEQDDDILNLNEPFEIDILEENINDPLTCVYCYKKYSRQDNLKRHIDNYCKVKKDEDEKDRKINVLIEEVTLLKELILKNGLANINTTNSNNNTMTNSNNKTTNNIQNNIQNNNTNVQVNISGFGKEIMEDLDIPEAMKVFLKSTGGNIIPNMFKHINMNKKYPKNHNICITDFAREIVKINDGKKCIFKKFKNAKYDIVSTVSNNINGIVDIYKGGNYKRTQDIDNKIEINNLSVRLINGEELTDDDDSSSDSDGSSDSKDSKLKEKNAINDVENFKVETKEEVEASIKKMIEKREKDKNKTSKIKKRLNVDHLNSKREGLQKLTFEKLKEELYSGKDLVNKV